MTKRTKSHQLETESFNQFESLIPPKWVFRRKSQPDYGIDGEVEIFDDKEEATGILFFVQLKSTDSKFLKDCLKQKIKVKTLKYYSKLEYPVLIVKYSKRFKKIHFLWAHSKHKNPISKGQKTTTIFFHKNNLLNSSNIQNLEKDVRNYLNIKKHKITSPIKLELKLERLSQMVLYSDLYLEFQKYGDTHKTYIDINKSEFFGEILLSASYCVVSLGGGCATARFKLNKKTFYDLEKLVSDINILTGILLFYFGQINISFDLFSQNYKNSNLLKTPQFLQQLLKCFYDANKFEDLFNLCTWAVEENKYLFEIKAFAVISTKIHDKKSTEERTFVERLLLYLKDSHVKDSDSKETAICFYNLGNFYHNTDDTKKALSCYNKARKWDEQYNKRAYYWRELGVILFNSGRVRIATKCYKNSLNIKDEKDTRALYADTLFFLSKYEEALKELNSYLKGGTETNQYWALKAFCAENLPTYFKINKTFRDPKNSSKIIEQKFFNKKEQLKAVYLDYLSFFGWFNLGVIFSKTKEFEKSFLSFLWSSFIKDHDIEAWTNALLISFNLPQNKTILNLQGAIIQVAYQINKEAFISSFFKALNSSDPSAKLFNTEKNEEILNQFLEILNQNKKEEKMEIRLLRDKEIEVIKI